MKVLFVIVILFLYCSCVVASRVDEEDEIRRTIEKGEKTNE